jgi:DNA-binding GntR family transcriptional regulator
VSTARFLLIINQISKAVQGDDEGRMAESTGTAARAWDPDVAPVARDTLQDQVYNQLAGLILDGGIAPGQLVTIQSLTEAFRVSAMPVREAFKRLTAANALTIVSGRTVGIPPLNLERLTDLRNVRLELEGTAAEWAARHIQETAIARLEADLRSMNQAIASGETRDYLRANRAFHFTLYRESRSATLVALIEIVWLQISPYFNLLRASGNYIFANAKHRTVIDALRHGDGPTAKDAIRADIDGSFEVLASILG